MGEDFADDHQAVGTAVVGMRFSADEMAPWAGIVPEHGAELAAELATHAAYDGAAWEAFDDEVRALASTLWRLLLMTPPEAKGANPDVLVSGLRFGWRYRRLEARLAREFTRMLPMSIADYLEDNLRSDALRAMLATRGLRYTAMGPYMAGTAAVMLTDSAGNGGGAAGESVYARGGPGALAASLAAAARAAGVEIRTGAPVIAIRDDEPRLGRLGRGRRSRPRRRQRRAGEPGLRQ